MNPKQGSNIPDSPDQILLAQTQQRDLPAKAPSAEADGLSHTQARDLPSCEAYVTATPHACGNTDGDRDAPDGGLGLKPGDVLAQRYEIRALIGRGGMGAVFSTFDRVRGEEIAVKVLLPHLLRDPQARERFTNEAKIASSLSHPNIVRVFDIQQDGDNTFLTMELLKGKSLREEIIEHQGKSQRFTVDEVRRIGEQLCDALSHAHTQTIHRDVKPENIWLCEDGTLKLMDFGIARLLRPSQFTSMGLGMGTAYYMAPEQLKAQKEIDHRADQYAVGVVLYELLTGEIPQGVIKSPQAIRRSVPAGLSHAVMKALAGAANERFADMAAFKQALRSRNRSYRVPLVTAAVLFLAAIGASYPLWISTAQRQWKIYTAGDWPSKYSESRLAAEKSRAAWKDQIEGLPRELLPVKAVDAVAKWNAAEQLAADYEFRAATASYNASDSLYKAAHDQLFQELSEKAAESRQRAVEAVNVASKLVSYMHSEHDAANAAVALLGSKTTDADRVAAETRQLTSSNLKSWFEVSAERSKDSELAAREAATAEAILQRDPFRAAKKFESARESAERQKTWFAKAKPAAKLAAETLLELKKLDSEIAIEKRNESLSPDFTATLQRELATLPNLISHGDGASGLAAAQRISQSVLQLQSLLRKRTAAVNARQDTAFCQNVAELKDEFNTLSRDLIMLDAIIVDGRYDEASERTAAIANEFAALPQKAEQLGESLIADGRKYLDTRQFAKAAMIFDQALIVSPENDIVKQLKDALLSFGQAVDLATGSIPNITNYEIRCAQERDVIFLLAASGADSSAKDRMDQALKFAKESDKKSANVDFQAVLQFALAYGSNDDALDEIISKTRTSPSAASTLREFAIFFLSHHDFSRAKATADLLNDELRSTTLDSVAWKLIGLGRSKEALIFAQDGVNAARKQNDSVSKIKNLILLSDTFNKCGDRKTTIDLLREAVSLQIATDGEDVEQQFRAISAAQLRLNDKEGITLTWQKAKAVLGRVPPGPRSQLERVIEPLPKMDTLLRIARYQALYGDIEGSRQTLQEVLQQLKAVPPALTEYSHFYNVRWQIADIVDVYFDIGDEEGGRKLIYNNLAEIRTRVFRADDAAERILIRFGDINEIDHLFEEAIRNYEGFVADGLGEVFATELTKFRQRRIKGFALASAHAGNVAGAKKYMRMDNVDVSKQVLAALIEKKLRDGDYNAATSLAKSFGEAGDGGTTEDIASLIRTIVEKQAKSGDVKGAITACNQISIAKIRDQVRTWIVAHATRAGLTTDAVDVAELIGDVQQHSIAYHLIADAFVEKAAFEDALSAISKIEAANERSAAIDEFVSAPGSQASFASRLLKLSQSDEPEQVGKASLAIALELQWALVADSNRQR